MKTFQQFQQDLKEFALAPAIPYLLPAAAAALGAAGMIYQSKKKKSQPAVDYGQGGETKARTPNVQRPSPKTSSARTQAQVARDDRRAEARERARENQATGQGELGRKAQEVLDQQRQLAKDAEYARQRRENPALRDAEAKQRAINARREAQRKRMEAAADKLGL